MLPARYRMRRSAEFSATVSRGVRAVEPDVVVHALHDGSAATGPRIGLVVSKAVGNAVERHLVSRRLRHAARTLIPRLDPTDLVVIRARPGSSQALTSRLEQQLQHALERLDARRRTSP
ncbi:ribonuclease P protein component [Mycobacterium frederiksbergense]|uniref:Ribonuclease P protein component n=1 Tax=Mycolicibacterium frederiksbergense TaxID=117567 RepID=A0ABT6L031_9MYCO|nr:ribonuclease P protein component [Mycolicibacterium frederiksbergense]MDH6195640.1 ribonuclease P protein component [Mycolicibacterium frederiksbergense]